MPKTKEQKRDEAWSREEARQARTAAEQMDLIRKRPGDSLRERDALIEQMEKEMVKR